MRRMGSVLVVSGAALLVGALLGAGVSRARQGVATATCLSNIRQIGLAASMYC